MKKLFVLSVALMLALSFAACSESAEKENGGKVFPASFSAYGESFSITGYRLGTDEEGNTVITSPGINVLMITDLSDISSMKIVLLCSFESGGKTYKVYKTASKGDTTEFTFETSVVPEKITFTNGETGETVVSFNVADVPQAK